MNMYHILYENDILFRLEEPAISTAIQPKKEVQQQAAEVSAEPVATPVEKIPKEQPVEPPITETPFPVLVHPLLILTDSKNQEALTESESTLLNNILKAVGHSMQEAEVINYSFLQNKDARVALSAKKVQHLISFGVPLIRLQIDVVLTPYTPKFIDGVWFLLADPLPVVEQNKDNKRKLWEALKRIFL